MPYNRTLYILKVLRADDYRVAVGHAQKGLGVEREGWEEDKNR